MAATACCDPTGRIGTPPVAGYRASLPPQHAAILDHVLQCSAVGGRERIADGIAAFLRRTGADEVMLTSSIYDHDARKHSIAIAAAAMQELAVPA